MSAHGPVELAAQLIDRKRFEEAKTILVGISPAPSDEPVHAAELARAAVGLKDYDTAISLVPNMYRGTEYAGSEAAAVSVSKAYQAKRLMADLERFSSAALRVYPASVGLLSAYAEVPIARRQWDLAERAIRAAMQAANPKPAASLYRKYSTALHRLGDRAAARQVLVDGLALHPADSTLLRARISHAMVDQSWAESSELLVRLIGLDGAANRLEASDVVRLVVCAHAVSDPERLALALDTLTLKFVDDRAGDVLSEEIRRMDFARDDNSLLDIPSDLITTRFPKHLAFKALLIRLRRGWRGISDFPSMVGVDYDFRDTDWRSFQTLMNDELGFFTNTLNSRQMLSVVETYADYGSRETRLTALLISNIFVLEKSFGAVKNVYDLALKTSPITDRQMPMWDGLPTNRLAGDDVFKIWLDRLQTAMSDADPVLGAMFYSMFTRMIRCEKSIVGLNIQHGAQLEAPVMDFVARFERSLAVLTAAPPGDA